MSRDWRSVQEMSIWLRKTETADRLYGAPTQQPFVRKMFYRRPTMAMTGVVCEQENSNDQLYEEYSPDEMVEVAQSPCNAMNRSNFNGRYGNNAGRGAPQTVATETKKSQCYNCKSYQHYFHDCDKPIDRIFCFKCGKDEVLAPNCDCKKSREHSKNGVRVAAVDAHLCDPITSAQ